VDPAPTYRRLYARHPRQAAFAESCALDPDPLYHQ
jgi:hypothetical protein